jgi:hypothetical protein
MLSTGLHFASESTALLDALKAGGSASIRDVEWERSVEGGWFPNYQIKDLLGDFGEGGWNSGHRLKDHVDELLAVAGVSMETYFSRPCHSSRSVIGGDGLRAANMAAFLAFLERCGLDIDPSPLVERILPEVKKLQAVSAAELRVLWYAGERHKTDVLLLTAAGEHQHSHEEQFKTRTGYKIDAVFAGEQVYRLWVFAPRHRRRSRPEDTTCEKCGYRWYKGDPESSYYHRREHKKRFVVLEPTPHPKFLLDLENGAGPEVEMVTYMSPSWRHREMYERALAFQREFGYDFCQWEHPKGAKDESGIGFLFNDDTGVFGHGAIVGACAFRWRTWEDAPHGWAMQWIWLAPGARRRGVLTRRWPMLRERFGAFHLESPLSEAMMAFAVKNGVISPETA